MKKLTAVEWTASKMNAVYWSDEEFDSIVEQAKKIEKEQMLMFHKWMKEVDTHENAERFFHYTDEDMLNEFLKEKYGTE